MNRNRIDELADVLLSINEGRLKPAEARKILADIDEVELSLAEQRLLERGKTANELRGLCKVHLQVLEMKSRDLKERTKPGHPIHTFVEEHDMILGFLDLLERAVNTIADRDSWEEGDIELGQAIEQVRHAAIHLVETEKHHQREEDALFPALDAKGITGPTRIMKLEHADLRPKKRALLTAVEAVTPERFGWFKHHAVELAQSIVTELREHIIKENSILYPAALDAISDDEVWREMRRQCDEIGYCCFTPATATA
ncbi:MAG: DUF438 domain-containing protein [Bacillota bacterium]|jgi:DUF438 domain-containing protein